MAESGTKTIDLNSTSFLVWYNVEFDGDHETADVYSHMVDSETKTMEYQLYRLNLSIKHQLRLSVSLSGLSCIVSVTSFILTMYMMNESKYIMQLKASKNGDSETLCIPQWLVSDHQLVHQLKNQTKRNGVNICLEDNDILSYFITHVLSTGLNRTVRLNEYVSKPEGQSTPVSAHLYLQPAIEKKAHNNQHFTLSLGHDLDPVVEHVRGSEVTQEGLHIFYTGVYFLYSNVNFKKITDASHHQTLFYYVNRESPNHPWNSGVLLRSAFTPCQDCVEFEETSFIGGVFYLQEGDYIRVCLSSDDDVVHFGTTATYVGLVMLSSKR